MSSAAALVVSPPAPTLLRLLAGVHADGTPVTLAEHLDLRGPVPDAHGLVELVESAGLRGLGGAGFPTGRKLRAVSEARGRPVVVANGTEGEPLSGKDKALLRCAPHLVLDGGALAATAVGAREAIIAVGAGARAEVAAVRDALAERKRRRLDRVSLRLVTVPEGFVAGEETALVNWLNGGPPKPTFSPPRPFERGVRGAPTLVQNVETLAQLALIARFGPEWFRAVGTVAEPGTVLVTLSGAVRYPGVYEIPLGSPLGELVSSAGGAAAPLQAFVLGGYFGTWVDAAEAARTSLSEADLRPVGASLGARAIYALPTTACGVVETARVARYLADESAGQCGPCVNGLDAIAIALERLASGRGHDLDRIRRWSRLVLGRGACRHPDGAVRFVESALDVFADEVTRHTHGRCTGERRPLLPVAARA